jgi:hypothetical protein
MDLLICLAVVIISLCICNQNVLLKYIQFLSYVKKIHSPVVYEIPRGKENE